MTRCFVFTEEKESFCLETKYLNFTDNNFMTKNNRKSANDSSKFANPKKLKLAFFRQQTRPKKRPA